MTSETSRPRHKTCKESSRDNKIFIINLKESKLWSTNLIRVELVLINFTKCNLTTTDCSNFSKRTTWNLQICTKNSNINNNLVLIWVGLNYNSIQFRWSFQEGRACTSSPTSTLTTAKSCQNTEQRRPETKRYIQTRSFPQNSHRSIKKTYISSHCSRSRKYKGRVKKMRCRPKVNQFGNQ